MTNMVSATNQPRRHANPNAAERGSTLLEFAVVIMVLLMMMFGIIDFGRALYTYHFVANAAREATRYASVRGSQCQVTSACPAQASDIATYVTSITPSGINSANVTTTSTWPGVGPGSSGTGGCNVGNGAKSPGCLVQVQVQYPFSFIFPLMPTSACQVGPTTANICMTSTSQMVISQ